MKWVDGHYTYWRGLFISIQSLILQITQPPMGWMILTKRMISPAEWIHQHDHKNPDQIHDSQIETKISQCPGGDRAGRQNVLMPVMTFVHEQQHCQSVDDV